jgi:hypothetical protein
MTRAPVYELWYVRREGQVRGPFPSGQIAADLLLGRLKLDSEVSQDKLSWATIAERPGLIPEAMHHLETLEGQRRFGQARRHADERRSERRHDSGGAGPNRRRTDRRRAEDAQDIRHRALMAALGKQEAETAKAEARPRYALPVLVSVFVIAGMAIMYLWGPPMFDLGAAPDCRAAPAPGINWSHCRRAQAQLARADLAQARLSNAALPAADLRYARLTGADLSYADLSGADLTDADLRGAILKGTVLRQARLARADLQAADLRYAILEGAGLNGVRLADARLDRAQWSDGRVCAGGSTGSCR